METLGIPEEAYTAKLSQAHAAFQSRWNLQLPLPEPQKDLQNILTGEMHQLRFNRLLATAGDDKERLLSLASPHATDWTASTSPWFSLTSVEYRAALRWILAVPLSSGDYLCPTCGAAADRRGFRTVLCSSSAGLVRFKPRRFWQVFWFFPLWSSVLL